ncbi:hypothetical protein HPB50_023046 [Hyalomma asiaticum]|uniref:Uncharacterized protein n=1 Tax=Hyalomma asiaticum TaxID=266040 RepID=A0ACB7TPM4_HYAAI|nr:hypothetical protein HPB50_023046 [Hyalomma asiaticum]
MIYGYDLSSSRKSVVDCAEENYESDVPISLGEAAVAREPRVLSSHPLLRIEVASQTGHQVVLVDVSKEVLEKSRARIEESVKRVAKKKFVDDKKEREEFVQKTLSGIALSTSADEAVKNTDLVVEAIVENIDVKKKLFAAIDKTAGP